MQKMGADLRLRYLAPSTRSEYLRYVAKFAEFHRKSPGGLDTDEVRAFLLHLERRGLAPKTRIVAHAALRFVFVETLGRPEVMATAPAPAPPSTQFCAGLIATSTRTRCARGSPMPPAAPVSSAV